MTKVKPKRASESGITLIALLVMIILLVILSAVAIHSIGGNHGLIDTSLVAAEDYKVTAMKEALGATAHEKIIEKATVGKIATVRRNSRKDKGKRRRKGCSNRRKSRRY